LADHCQDIAFPRSERITDAAAGLCGAVNRIAGIPLRKWPTKGGSSRSFDVGVPVLEINVGVIELLLICNPDGPLRVEDDRIAAAEKRRSPSERNLNSRLGLSILIACPT
jgi:hypothetical protein